jgi:putative addiction module component (TIGR02574 family)
MMTVTLTQVKNEALLLSLKERALLVCELLDSLDTIQDTEIEQAWITEAENRYARYVSGQTTSRPASDVFASIHALLQ